MPVVNICEIFQKRDELQQQYREEINTLKGKFAKELKGYNADLEEFNKKWEPIMSIYRREGKLINQKYKRLMKEL